MAESKGPRDGGVDVRQISLDEIPETPFPATLGDEYRVVICDSAYRAIREHASVDTSVELGGVLAGQLMRDSDGPYLLVEHAVRGIATRRTGSQVTFTHETWSQIHDDMSRDHPDLQIVGWYHSHPGFGIFLSEMDQFIQDHFFNLPHQAAFVYDPIADTQGLFIWKSGSSARLHRYWLNGEVHYDLNTEDPAQPEHPSFSAERSTATPEPKTRAQSHAEQPPVRRGSFTWLAAGVIALLVAFWLGSTLTRSSDIFRLEQANALESLIRTGFFRDGLGRELNEVGRRLNRAHASLQAIENHSGGARNNADRDQILVAEARTTIADAHSRLKSVERAYTEADRLARRMGNLTNVTEDLRTVRVELGAQRALLAALFQVQADQVEKQGGSEAERLARDLREVATRLVQGTEVPRRGFGGLGTSPAPTKVP